MSVLLDNLVLIGLLVATLLVLLLLAVVVSAALRGGGAHAAKPLRLLGADSLRQSFRRAVGLVEKNLAARSERYNLSWTLLLNESASDELPLMESGLHSVLSADSSLGASAQGLAWNFFDKGVVVQLRSSYLGAPDADKAGAGGVWDDLLGLCRSYRPQRPFDSLVLAIPCAVLLHSDPAGQLALVERAKSIHRRLWLAQNRLAMRFPIHLLVTECEQVPGFASFGAALPESMRRSILGWASPHELVAPFRSQWVDSAMAQIVGAVADSCAELCALEPADADSSAYFLLPSELERLRAGLKGFCEELMRPSAYHDAFLLRGIYLTGDCSAGAVLQARSAGLEAAPLAHLPALATPAQDAAAPAPRERMPAFLRDVFERKIFAEVGLVRSSSQRMRRPAASRLASWSIMAAPGVWAIGLSVAAFQLHHQGGVLASYLQTLDEPVHRAGPAEDEVQSQRRAVAVLDSFEPVGGNRFYSVFMPGSWPIVDDLHEQLQARLEQGFADNAVVALHGALLARVNRLTGVARDPRSGELVDNGGCALPSHWSTASPAAGLNLQNLPEYGALLGYLTRLDEINLAIGAMQRLAEGKEAASGADLALAVRVLLKKELRGTPTRTAALFRAAAKDARRLDTGPIRAAANCSLRLASTAMYQRLFDQNGLLRAEQAVDDDTARLRGNMHRGADLAGELRVWQDLRSALEEQQQLLLPGQGGWMHQPVLDLGSAQDAMLKRIAANPLLGPAAAQDSKELAVLGFARFAKAWDRTAVAANLVDGSAGLVWAGTGWAFTPERKALHDAVAGLMAQPYMKAGVPLHLPEVAAGATIDWDRSQLERATSLAGARKAFLSGVYMALPNGLQQPAGAVVDRALATEVRSALAQALSVAPQQLPSAASDDERASVLRLRAWLQEIGARDVASELDAALARDALSRLARLNDVFDAAQVYLPRDATFQNWQGQKGVMLDAFGGGDPAVLNAYLEQQQEFIDTIVQQANGVLAELDSSAEGGLPLVARWQALAADQRRYRLKSPTSSRMALESFIATGSGEIDSANCIDKLAGRQAQRRGGDLFAERLQSLQSGILARCRELAAGDDARTWEHFAEAYNRDLGKRAPFVALPGGAPGADTIPADRETVGAVMQLYDRAHAASARSERDPGQPGARPAVRKADQQLRRVHDLVAPLYPAEEGQTGGLDVAVEFRAHAGAEAGANQIIDWSLTIGSATTRLGGTARVLRWEPGMPVLLSLRLARDGTVVPKPESGDPNISVADRTVTFRFDDPWALFSFVSAYRDGDTQGDDGRAPLLRLEFPLARAGAAMPLPQPETRARVFLRLRVSAPGTHTPLAWPAAFPAQVPLWHEPQKTPL